MVLVIATNLPDDPSKSIISSDDDPLSRIRLVNDIVRGSALDTTSGVGGVGVTDVDGGVSEVAGGGVTEVDGGVSEVAGGVTEVEGGVSEVAGGVSEVAGGSSYE